jgi:hypothetical protein
MGSMPGTTVVELPEPEPQSLLLVPQPTEPTKKGKPLPEFEPLGDRLVVGVVAQPVKLGVAGIPDPQEFPESEFAGFRFFLVHLAITMLGDRAEPFVEVQVDVPLEGSDGVAEPIAWSMAPDRLDDKIQLSREFSINATLKVVGIGAVEGGPEAGWTAGKTINKKQPFLLAARELTARPEWRLRRTEASDIDGMTRLSLVVRAPEGTTTRGTVKLSARVERERLKFFTYEAELPDREPVPFTLA